ncbi:MAG: tail fiber domain-containing protein [Desulfocapsaceae bacterium]|nr:tail fiber domain-containing protein [Desulfocapsaceae bacterium]
MKKHLSKKAAMFGLALLSAFSADWVMAADQVVVIPMASSKIYTFGVNNLFAGKDAGNHTMTGTDNTGIGYGVLHANTTGGANTAIGSAALKSNTTGIWNAASGRRALEKNINGHDNTASGGDALQENTSGYYNTANGSLALAQNTVGWQNTAVGGYAGYSNTTGSYNTFVGYNTHAGANNLNNVTAIGIDATPTVSNSVRIGNGFVTSIGGNAAWSNLSDMRNKRDIQDITRGLDFINALRPVEYRMNNGNDRVDFGFLAQDIETLLGTDYNVLGIGGDPDRTLSLRYTDFIAPMVKAMQEQQEIIEQQKKVNEQQEESITEMRSELNDLKAEIRAMKAGK